jgi:nucleotide-binding universal stress UspA family protein
VHLHTQRIIVGVDGSARSRDAARWALEQSRGTDTAVHLVHAWHAAADEAVATRERLPAAVERTPEVTVALEHAYDQELGLAREKEQAVKAAEERKALRLLERIRDAAVADDRDRDRIHLLALEGDAGPTLVSEATDADLLVVSSHRATRITAMLGSVSLYCTLHAQCPVVVLPTAQARRAGAHRRRALQPA